MRNVSWLRTLFPSLCLSERRSRRARPADVAAIERLEVRRVPSSTVVALVPPSALTASSQTSDAARVQQLTWQQFGTLTPAEIPLLTTAQIASIPSRAAFRAISVEARRALTHTQVTALVVHRTGVDGLTRTQLNCLTHEQVRLLKFLDFDRLSPGQVVELSLRQVDRIRTQERFDQLPQEVRYALSRKQVRALDVTCLSIRGLSDEQIAQLSNDQRQRVPSPDRPWLRQRVDVAIEYQGFIRVPNLPFDPVRFGEGRHFGYSNGAFAYVPERNSFLMLGHNYGQQVAEISNPGPGRRATLRHDFVDVTEGGLAAMSASSPHAVEIQSLLYRDGRVLLSAEQFYNVQGRQLDTHGSFATDLDHPEFSGWWGVGDETGQSTGFYMAHIPEPFAAGGRDLLTGGSISWRAGSSAGPAALLVDPDRGTPGRRLRETELLRYLSPLVSNDIDYSDPTDRGAPLYDGGVEGWTGNSYVGGAAVLGERLVFVGREGTGYDFYGTPDEYEQQTGIDDAYGGKGYHSGPYRPVLWVYSLPGLIHGHATVQRIEFPWALSPDGQADLRSVAIHGDTLYVTEASAMHYGLEPVPVIHVLKLHTATGDEQAAAGATAPERVLSLPDPIRD